MAQHRRLKYYYILCTTSTVHSLSQVSFSPQSGHSARSQCAWACVCVHAECVCSQVKITHSEHSQAQCIVNLWCYQIRIFEKSQIFGQKMPLVLTWQRKVIKKWPLYLVWTKRHVSSHTYFWSGFRRSCIVKFLSWYHAWSVWFEGIILIKILRKNLCSYRNTFYEILGHFISNWYQSHSF